MNNIDNKDGTQVGTPDPITNAIANLKRATESSIATLDERCTIIESENKSLSKQCSDLKNQCDELKKTNESVERQLTSLSSRISQKADTSLLDALDKKCDELSYTVSRKADKGSVGASSSEMRDAQRKHGLNTCLFLCAIMIFNIFATWFIIYRPNYVGFGEISNLPWTYILPLMIIMFGNIASTVIWFYHFRGYGIHYVTWEKVVELVLLAFNIVAMWLFAFHPLQEVTSAVIALAVFLMFVNILMFFARVLYFATKYISTEIDKNILSLTVSISGTVLLVVILIIFIFWIRV